MIKPNLKESFSVEDIHKLREYNYERTKEFTEEELVTEINKKADIVRERVLKKKKQKMTA